MGKHQSKIKPGVLEDLRSVTLFDDAEIIKWYKSFRKDCPTRLLNIEDFKTMYGNYFPSGDASVFAENVFRAFDTNGDGSIDFREFLCAISITSKGKIGDKLELAFNMYDLDKDGFITKGEMLEIVTSIDKMAVAVLKIPKDKLTPENKMEIIFCQMDADRDGRISLKEFIEVARNNVLHSNKNMAKIQPRMETLLLQVEELQNLTAAVCDQALFDACIL